MTRLLAVVAAATVAAAVTWHWSSRGDGHLVPAAASARATDAREFWAAYKAASARRSAGDCAAAIEQYTRALAIRPGHEDSLYYLGNCHAERGARDQALAAYRQLVDANPEGSSRGYMQMGLVLGARGPDGRRDLEAAERQFTRALEMDSDSGALLGLAEVALLRHRWHEARRRLAAAGADNGMSVAVPYLQAYLSFRDGDRATAWRLFQVAVARGEMKKGPVTWSEEGDVKADPALRWRALARQSLTGEQWARLRRYVQPPGPTPADMEHELRALAAIVEP